MICEHQLDKGRLLHKCAQGIILISDVSLVATFSATNQRKLNITFNAPF